VINNKNSTLSRLIVFEPAWLDFIHITVISADGQVESYEGGNTFPYEKRTIDHYLNNFKHSFNTGISTVYIQVKTRDPFIVSISLMKESDFLLKQSEYYLWIGFIYGGIIAMLLYNFFLYFGIKKRYYAFYVLYLLSFLLMNASYNGYTFMRLFSEYPEIQNWSQSISIYFFVLSALLFARSFLNLKKYHSTLYMVTTYFIYAVLIIFFLSIIVGGYHLHVILSIVLVMVKSIYLVSIAFYSWIKGNRSARFFLLGTSSGLVGAFVTALTVMSFIPYTYITYKASDMGMFIDVVLLSIALADRMKITHEEKLTAEKEAKTDALTGLLNRRSYDEIIKSEDRRLHRYHRNFSVMILDIDDFKVVNDTYGHHEGDRQLKCVASIIKENMRENDYAFRMGGDEFVLLLPETNEDQAYHIAQHMRREIENMNTEHSFTISSSFGISEFKLNDENLEIVIKRADEILYQAKKSGKNSVKIWK
jgi:diguanylate cyclase (GGDEF)-like protein